MVIKVIRVKPKIEFIKLELMNFGPYKGKHQMEFSNQKKKNITLIQGDQGSGKSSIFQLIWWLLFPTENSNEKENELKFFRSNFIKDAVNKLAIKGVKVDEKIKFGGIIEFNKFDRSNNSTNYIIARYVDFKKTNKGIEYLNGNIDNSETFTIYQNSEKVSRTQEIYEKVVYDFFPKSVRDFVFIFGEGLSRILSMENVGKIKDDAINISDKPRLNALTYYLECCEESFNKLRQDVNKKYENLEKIQSRLDELKEQRIKMQGNYENEQSNLDGLRMSVSNARNEIGRIRGNLDFIKEYNTLTKSKSEFEKSKNDIIKAREEDFLEYLPLIYLEDPMKRIKADLTEKRIKNIIPGKITSEMLKLVLDRDAACVCGSEWTQEMRDRISKLVQNAPQTKSIENISKFESKLDDKLSIIKKAKIRVVEKEKAIKKVNNDISKIDNRIRYLKQNISEEERQEEWYEKIITLENIISNGDQLIGRSERSIEHFLEEIGKLEVSIKETNTTYVKEETKLKKAGESIDYSKYLNAIDSLKNITSEMKNLVSEKIRILTQKEILKALKKLARDPENWEEVKIDDEKTGWVIRATNKNKSVLTNISTGQSNIVGISFIYALSNILDIDLPLIIDSPFINIDLLTRKAVIENLPALYEGRQLVFFTKKTEFLGPVDIETNQSIDLYPTIKDNIGIEYVIKNETNDNAKLQRRI